MWLVSRKGWTINIWQGIHTPIPLTNFTLKIYAHACFYISCMHAMCNTHTCRTCNLSHACLHISCMHTCTRIPIVIFIYKTCLHFTMHFICIQFNIKWEKSFLLNVKLNVKWNVNILCYNLCAKWLTCHFKQWHLSTTWAWTQSHKSLVIYGYPKTLMIGGYTRNLKQTLCKWCQLNFKILVKIWLQF
jgi:hypothetical protein